MIKLHQHCKLYQMHQVRLDVTWYLQTCFKLLKQLASSLGIKSFDNVHASSLLMTFYRQAGDSDPVIGLMTARQQACCKVAPTCAFQTVNQKFQIAMNSNHKLSFL